jgi:dienelactone hydrolase
MKRRFLKLCFLSIGLTSLFAPHSALGKPPEEFTKGQVIEKVICKADASFSYALYLPSNYAPHKKWPVVYGFDPAARGRLPVEQFKDAAEKYGYLLAGSNDSRNGPGVSLNKILQAIWADTHERFSIDEKRVYTTGFSGGARAASAIAYSLPGAVAGVIACGAGFHPNITPSKSIPFAFFATIGTEDFNMPELRALDKALDEFAIAHRVEIFTGDHAWASSELCTEAIEWMELQAMRTGRAPKNEPLIDQLWKKKVEQAKADGSSQNVYQTYLSYSALAADFKGLRETAEFENQAKQLQETKPVKEQIKQEREEDQRQMKMLRELLTLKESLEDFDNRAVALSQLKSAIANLKKRADEKEDSSERQVARRTLGAFSANSFEGAQALLFAKNYSAAAANLEIAALVRPESAGIFFSLARAYAMSGNKKKALEALKNAVEKGLTDAAAVERNDAFISLREDAEFKRIVGELKKRVGSQTK